MAERAPDGQVDRRGSIASHGHWRCTGGPRTDVDQFSERAFHPKPEGFRKDRGPQLSAERGTSVLPDAEVDSIDGYAIFFQRDRSRRGENDASSARRDVEPAQVEASSNTGRIRKTPRAPCGRRQGARHLSYLLPVSWRDQRANPIVVERDLARNGIAGAIDDLELRAGADIRRRGDDLHRPAFLERQPAV